MYILLTVCYVLSGKLGLMLALPPGYVSPIFPPAGIAVAAVLIGGRTTLPWIFAGSLLLNVWVGFESGQPFSAMDLAVAAAIAIASTLQAAIGGWGLRRAIGYPVRLDHSAEIMRFLLLAPLICLISASLSVGSLCALGVIASADFAGNWAAWWVGDTLGLVVMLPLVMIAAGEPRALWSSRRRTVAVPILLIFALFVVIFFRVNQWENSDSLEEFRQLSQQSVNQVQTKLEEQEFLLEQTASLFLHDKTDRVTREEFHLFVEKALIRFPMIQALEWAAPVDASRRAAFEAAQRVEVAGFEIRERNAEGQLQRAGERNAYYPVIYVEPVSGNEPAMGFDLASNLKRQGALAAALKQHGVVMSPAVQLVQERQRQKGVLLILAVNPQDPQSGAVLSVLRMGDFLDGLLKDTRPVFYTRLVDIEDGTRLYDNFAGGTVQALYQHHIDFGTRHYRLETAPTPAYFRQHRGWQSWSVLAAGMLGTALLGSLLLLGTGHTARIEAEVEARTRELSESKKRLQEAQRLAQIGSWELKIDANALEWSDEIYRIFEIDQASFGASYEAFLSVIHPDDRSLVDRAYDESVRNRKPYSVEHRLLFPDGRVKYVHERGETFYDGAGKPLRSVGTVQDITAQKLVEHALRRESEKNQAILRNASDGIHILDLKGNVIEVSDSFCAMLGYRRDEMIGMNVADWDTTLGATELMEIIRRQYGNRTRIQFETRHRRKDGTIFDVEISALPLMMDDRPVMFFSSRDITERKVTEERIRNLAFYDTLTQLPNRRLLQDRLELAMAAGRRSDRYAALMVLDLDNFKALNDSYGHIAGDQLLVEVAVRLKSCVRASDTVARFGGDEFVVVLGELNIEKGESVNQVALVAEKIRTSLADPYLITVKREGADDLLVEHHCTASIGVMVFDRQVEHQEDILKWADVAMYQAKKAGRNRIRFYQADS